MTISQKYGRTYHYPFSPGNTSDDRIALNYWQQISTIPSLIHTEKLDGENNCLSRYGVFARSHATPTTSPWTETLRIYWQSIRNDLGSLEIFLENVYAIHSLEYMNLDHHFYVFAIREGDRWLGWEETKFYAAMLDLPTVPELFVVQNPTNESSYESMIKTLASGSGSFKPCDVLTGTEATMEGIVTRNAEDYPVNDFVNNVFKYVRAGHVQTDQHWTRNWKRAQLNKGGKSCGL